jgi:hypothetical protein
MSQNAVVSEKIPLPADNKHVHAFKHTYDRLFAEFHANLMAEYSMMKQGYIADYQANYTANMDAKQSNINGFMQSINDKDQASYDLEKEKEANMSCMNRFFEMKRRLFYYRVFMKYWKKYIKHKKEKKRVAAYSRNSIYRNILQRQFRMWRTVTHEWGKERINREESTFRKNLEREKLTMWTSKVDQLMLYMA